jgi:uncharacterized damage-inducible protein DinB
MEIRQMILPQFDNEMQRTRAILERVPEDRKEYTPHHKSTPMGKLAAHTAQLPEVALYILETPSLDFSTSGMKPLVMESRQQLLAAFDALVEKTRKAITNADDAHWQKSWKLSFQGKMIAEGPRFLMYHGLFLNHQVHHRAQLGVYLRLNEVPLPAIYGPSADDRMGF